MSGDSVALRLVEWNVAMSIQTKAHLLATLQPSIAVLPEAAHPDKTGPPLRNIGATSMEWTGASPNKGLLVAAFGDWTVRPDPTHDAGYQWAIAAAATTQPGDLVPVGRHIVRCAEDT